MGPLDWLKNKLGQGVSDIGHVASSVAGDIESAVGGNNAPAAVQPSASQSGAISVAQPAQSGAIRIDSSNAAAGPSTIQVQGSNPAPSAAQTGINGPTPVIQGSRSVSDINNALNNPLSNIESGTPGTPKTTATQVITGQKPSNAPTPTPDSGLSLSVNKMAPPAVAPPHSNPGSTTVQNVATDAGKFGVDVVKGLVSGAAKTVSGDIVEPARATVAQITNNPQAEAAANIRATQDQNASLPTDIVNNVLNIGKSGYNLGFKTPIEDLTGNPGGADQARTVGLQEFNQTIPGAVATPFERLVANLTANNDPTKNRDQLLSGVGINPAENLTSVLLNSGLNAAFVGKPAYGLGEQFAETPVGETLLGTPGRVASGFSDIPRNEIGAVGSDVNLGENAEPAENPQNSTKPQTPVEIAKAAVEAKGLPISTADDVAGAGTEALPPPEPEAKSGFHPDQQAIINGYAGMLKSMDDSFSGGMMRPDGEGGYVRITEHSPFYRQFFARTGHAPSARDWQAEAEKELSNGRAEGSTQEAFDKTTDDLKNPEVQSLNKSAETPVSEEEASARAVNDFTQSVPEPIKTAVDNTGLPANELASQATPLEHVMENSTGEPIEAAVAARIAKDRSEPTPIRDLVKQRSEVATDRRPGFTLAESRPTVKGGFHQTVEMIKNPKTGKFEQTVVDHINGQRLPRNTAGERAALDVLRKGGIRADAMRAYQEVTNASDKEARYAVQRAAQEAGVAVRPNERGTNPQNFSLPEVKEGDYGKARSNPQIAKSLIENRAMEVIPDVRKLEKKGMTQSEFWSDVEDGGPTGNKLVDRAIKEWRDLADTVNATDNGSKMPDQGKTPYIKNYAIHDWDLSDPEDAARFEQIAQQQGFELDPYDYSGVNNRPRIFASVAEGEAAGFHLTDKPLSEVVTNFANSASMRIGDQALAKSFDEAMGSLDERKMQFNVREGTHFPVSPDALKQLQGYAQRDDVNALHQAYRTLNRKAKQTILSISLYHPNNINFFQVFPTLLAEGHPVLAFKALAGSYAALASKGLVTKEIEVALNDGTVEAAARIGTPIRWGSDYANAGRIQLGKEGFGEKAIFERSIPYAHIQLARAVLSDLAKDGVDLDSPEARAAGITVNRIMGFINREVQNGNPHVQGFISDVFFAPQFTRAKWEVLGDALSKGGTAGSYARSAVIGKYLMQVGITMAASAINHQNTDSTKDMFLRNLVSPSIPTPTKNAKGTNIELSMPQNYISEGLSLGGSLVRHPDGSLGISFRPGQVPGDLAQYARNRLAVVPSTGVKVATNTSFAGSPLRDTSAPAGTQAIQVGVNAANSLLPISLQGLATTKVADRILPPSVKQAVQINNPNGSLATSILSSTGFTPKPDKTTGYDLQSTNYFNKSSALQSALRSGNLSAIDKSMPNVSSQEGQYWLNQYLSLHPQNTKDLTTGQTIPRDWNALSNEQKASFYLANNQKTGAQQLSPVFYIDKDLAQQDPTRPHDPIFDLSGNGVGVDGKATPKAQIALNYTNMTTGDPQRTVLLAANPWLTGYETSVGNYSQNYQKNMTSYLQQQGWSNQAISDYWTQHPSNSPPIQPPTFDANTQSVMDAYNAITDPTSRSQFFSQNADVLSNAFDQEAQYVNQKRLASGDLALQGYPVESDHVKQVLDSMPSGTDSASKSARGQLINSNPDVNQYLADVSLYDTTKNLSQYRYQDPSHPNMTEDQLLNLPTTTAQSTLKDISNLGSYDIGKNSTTGQYDFMQNGSLAAGDSGSSSQSKPFVANPRRPYQRHTKIRKPFLKHAKFVKVKHTKSSHNKPVKIQHGNQFHAPSFKVA